jgi:GT2 family glycosyltransferase
MTPWTFTLIVLSWLVALAWVTRVLYWLFHIRQVANLLRAEYATAKTPRGKISVVVPARNEVHSIRRCVESLLEIEGVELEILAVDDRSTDGTGLMLDNLKVEAHAEGKQLQVMHITVLPAGWTGKAHAMSVAAAQATGEWLLFTDADVLFREDVLRRALVYMEREKADHLVVMPTLICHTVGERMMMSFLFAMAIWGPRPWKVQDRESRDAIGVGAFNLVRRSAYDAIGGWESLRMEMVEDLRLAYVLKRAGFAARVAMGRNLVRIRWAKGAFGVMRNLTKNLFAVFRFRTGLMLAACCGIALLCLLPFWGLLAGLDLQIPSLLTLAALVLLYLSTSRDSGSNVLYLALFPVAAALFLLSMLRSTVLTQTRRGVMWRGTFYPVEELRKHAGPLR